MENLKNQIKEILYRNQEVVYGRGSCGELGESFYAICSEDFQKVANQLIELIQIVFDPENQPNQLGIENPFDYKYCMPDEIETKEDHEEYLRAIGFKK